MTDEKLGCVFWKHGVTGTSHYLCFNMNLPKIENLTNQIRLMNENTSNKPPVWFWIVSILAFIWNLMGVSAFIMQVTMTPENMAALPEAERILQETTPMWANIAFAVAVFGGALGCLFLLLKNQLAVSFLVTSMAGVIIQMIHSFFFSNSYDVFGPGGMIMPIMVIVVGVLLIWLSISAVKKGWIS